MTTICLVRHGETDWNSLGRLQGRTDIPLNSKGILQAEECGCYLKHYGWDVMITSPLKRAKETAEIINKDKNIPLVEMDEFLERYYGDAEGMTLEERLTAFPNRNYPNQEDRDSINKRIMNGIQKINKVYSGKEILLVAHGAVINSVLAKFSNGEIGSGKTKLINACISNIEFVKEEWIIKNYNQVNHLSQYSEKGKI
ncbi:histidine phosphatase family protein [Salipaludibacillus sp. HK11]|uniref:histidine phosphatase family protein n=1 Tax=Salipaludibacillus sp. HK11 TaxID=3394320 RepID=UPI0039FC46BB